ncbi:amidase [Halorubrum sp. RMP-47]|uniref:Amidase n=1 Tax=Halorubrum miltondacostae TaxID=3076378 RepID=A0ABD5M4G7_9EURY
MELDALSSEQVRELAERHIATLDEETAERFAEQFGAQDDLLQPLFELPTVDPPERASRRATDEGDPLGAFITQCEVEGDGGPLSDMTIGVKDNIAVAGVPMTCGSPALEEHIPSIDATVVSRLLSAGATIGGKTNMDEFAFGGDKSTMRIRLAHNPHDETRQPGSSSAGSGVAVATGQVDAALGSDTGGSVRFPAAWCGVVGLKPTRGAVSHNGFVQYAKTLDNIGILGPTVEAVARVFEHVAGPDPTDERTMGASTNFSSERVTETNPENLTIGVVADLVGNAPELDAIVEERLDELSERGAEVREVNIADIGLWLPAWLGLGMAELSGYLANGGANTWALSPGRPATVEAVSASVRTPAQIGDPVLSAWLYGQRLRETDSAVYSRAHMARERVTDGVDTALADVDVLASTTVPMLPPEWGDGIENVFEALSNTGVFNVTGHPAVSVPVGAIRGLPVGLQFIAPHGHEATALGAGYTAMNG